ncbi:MAG TPA: Holliday junction resolvase RuvX, partial [Tistrella mobilis]|nr:Holliday junction resolvase RuvX [Tistrella mobilis]
SEADSEAGPEAPSKPAPKPDLTPWQLARMLPAKGRIMGLDVGTKTVGIAVSDELRRVATPIELIRRTKFRVDAARMAAIVRERGVVAVVLGLPVNMD